MDNLYIGAKYYAGKIQYEDGTIPSSTPTLVLYNRASKSAYAKAGELTSEQDGYDVTFTPDETLEMIPGVYDMEIYLNYGNEDVQGEEAEQTMIKHVRDAVNAIKVSVSTPSNT